MRLVEIDTKPQSIKFMFANAKSRFAYYTMSKEELSVTSAIGLAKLIGSWFNVAEVDWKNSKKPDVSDAISVQA